MWAKRTLLPGLLLGLTFLVGGCFNMRESVQMPEQNDIPAAAEPSADPVAPEDLTRDEEPRAEQAETLQEGINLITAEQYQKGIDTLKPLIGPFEELLDKRYVARTLYWLGFAEEKLSRLDEAEHYYSWLLRRYPNTKAAELARRRLLGLRS